MTAPEKTTLPPELVESLESRLGDLRPALFLDYDGTLTPIVDRPEDAVLSEETRDALRRCADRLPVVIVSGRGREDVASLVDLPELVYAGSHGLDIAGPGEEIRHQAAADVAPAVAEATARLRETLEGKKGALVEPKRFSVAVHYRLAAPDAVPQIERAVDEVLEDQPELKKTHGKKVFEIRPRIDWDKGKAVLWLLEALDLDREDILPLYVGDDTTDEDAFRALKGRGLGLLVAEEPRPSEAELRLRDPAQVRDLLDLLADFGA